MGRIRTSLYFACTRGPSISAIAIRWSRSAAVDRFQHSVAAVAVCFLHHSTACTVQLDHAGGNDGVLVAHLQNLQCDNLAHSGQRKKETLQELHLAVEEPGVVEEVAGGDLGA